MRDEIHKKRLKIDGLLSFKDFVFQYCGKEMLKPQMHWLKNYKGEVGLDYVGRFENLNNDFREICTFIQAAHLELPHAIKGAGKDYRARYDQESLSYVGKIYKEEIRIFGYQFN